MGGNASGPLPGAAGGYRPLAVLGQGGMGVAYVARRNVPGARDLGVIKRPHPHVLGDPGSRMRFYHEALVATTLRHPCIVRTIASGEDAEGPYLVLEYVHGVTLEDLLDRASLRGRSLGPGLVAAIAGECARGLVALHGALDDAGSSLRIVHRDICPQNIFLGVDGSAKLGDFGISKSRMSAVSTDSRYLLGKITYLPPEYLLEGHVSPALDVYALGTVLHLAVAGVLPFVARTEGDLAREILTGEQVPLSSARPELPRGLADLIDAMRSQDRLQRPTAFEIFERVNAFFGERAWRDTLKHAVEGFAGKDLSARLARWRELCDTQLGRA